MKSLPTRRDFLLSTAVAAPLFASASALGLDGSAAPSDRTTACLVGIGCLGRSHLGNLVNHPKVEVLGICDVDQWRLENGREIVKKGYAARNRSELLDSCIAHHDFPEMFARNEIDAAVVVMGDRWHSPAVKLATAFGKDVFVEKPCALTVDECLELSEPVRARRRVVQIGLQQRSDATFQYACRTVRGGRLGRISHVYVVHDHFSTEVDLPAEPVPPTLDWERWLGPCPLRPWNHRFHHLGFPKNVVPWSFCRDFGNGGIADGGVHAWDIVNWGLGMEYLPGPDAAPGKIRVEGTLRDAPVFDRPLEIVPRGTSEKYHFMTFLYPGCGGTTPGGVPVNPDGVVAQIVHGRVDSRADFCPPNLENEPVQPFGAIFVGERGWISVGRQGYLKASDPELIADRTSTGSENHLWNFIESLRVREEPNCPVERGCEATLMSTLGSLAGWLGRTLRWDLNERQFLVDAEATRCRRRTPRGDWQI